MGCSTAHREPDPQSAGTTDLGRMVTTQVDSVGTLRVVYMTDPEGNIIEIQSWS